MKLLPICLSCLLVLKILEISTAADEQSYTVLRFGETVGDYIKFKPNMQPLSDAFSICSWIQKLRAGSSPCWFSYASNSQDNEIFLYDEGSENTIFQSYNINAQSQAGVTIGDWYHYCLCWNLISRTVTIYHNGRQTGSTSTPSGRRLTANGYLVLGQDQDSYGGGFQSSQSFGGQLYKLNVFSKKLSSSEVSEMYSAGRCSDIEKKHDGTRQLKWEQILLQPRTGNVRAIIDTPSYSCALERELELVKGELAETRKELNDTKASKEEISDQLNRTTINLDNNSSELDEVRANLKETTGQLTGTETQLNQTEAQLNQTEAQLNQTEAQLNQTEAQLNQTEAQLNQTEAQLNQTEAQLNQTETDLEETGKRLNEILTDLEVKEEELQEIKTGLSGYNCFRVTNSSHWDILYTASFFDKVLTEEMLEILNNSWEKLEYFKGTSVTESFIEFFKTYFYDGLDRCDV